MFEKLFDRKSKNRKTGVYRMVDQSLEELDELPGGGSINDIINGLGYHVNHILSIMTFDSKTISNIGVKIFTRDPVFIITNDRVKNLRMSTVISELKNVDWDFEYESSAIESMLTDGIKNKSLPFDYLESVTLLESKAESIYLAKNLDLYFHFEDDILVNFTSTDGLNADSKWLKNLNKPLFENILIEAKTYHSSKMDAIEEVNRQCVALRSIPNANKNEFIDQHRNPFGNYNYYNLWAAHYISKITMKDFMLVNRGRFLKLSKKKLKVNGFVYRFSKKGNLKQAWKE